MPDIEDLIEQAKAYQNYEDMTPEERERLLETTGDWIQGLSPEEQKDVVEKLRVAAGVSPVAHAELSMLQGLYHVGMDQMDEDGITVEELFGVSEESLQLFASWLDMEALRFEELKDMDPHEGFVAGMLIGIRLGILLQTRRSDGS